MGELLHRLRLLFSRSAAPPRAVPGPPTPSPVSSPVSEPVPDTTAPGGDPLSGASAFAPFASALGLQAPAPPPEPDPEEEAASEESAARVLAHFQANRPGPASAPTLSMRILTLVAAPETDVSELARLVSSDPALAAGVLTVANSPALRGLSETETVRDAITRLGFEEVARVAGAVSARSLFNPRLKAELAAHGPRFAALYRRAFTVANGAAWLALQRRNGRSDRAFLGGMLHDVGKTIALRSVAALLREGRLQLPGGDPQVARLLDSVHLEIGGEVHQEWGLPQYLTVMAVRHHDESIPGDAEFEALHEVRLVAALQDLADEPAFAARAATEVVQSAAALGMGPLQARELCAELRAASHRASTTFGL